MLLTFSENFFSKSTDSDARFEKSRARARGRASAARRCDTSHSDVVMQLPRLLPSNHIDSYATQLTCPGITRSRITRTLTTDGISRRDDASVDRFFFFPLLFFIRHERTGIFSSRCASGAWESELLITHHCACLQSSIRTLLSCLLKHARFHAQYRAPLERSNSL